MPKIYNNELIKDLINKARLSPSSEKMPNEVADKILPVMNIEDRPEIKVVATTLSDGSSSTLATTSTTRRTFLVGAIISYAKDVNATSTSSGLQATPLNMSQRNLITVRYEPLTAGQGSEVVFFPLYGVELQKGTNINVTNSSATASIDTTLTIYYYETE